MKRFISGLFALALFASGAAWAADLPGKDPPGPFTEIPAGLAAVCVTNGGIVVLIVTHDGKFLARKCGTFNGSPITEETSLPANMTEFVLAGTLGLFIKYRVPGQTDPCYEYTVGGESHIICW